MALVLGMNWRSFGLLDKWSRSAAYDIICRRDGLSGWKPHRDAFLSSVKGQRESLLMGVQDKLRGIIGHAYASSPYYRKLWNETGFIPSSRFQPQDLQRLPFLTKDILRREKLLIVSSRFQPQHLILSYTGGTTGVQTPFYMDAACRIARVGRQWGILKLCGYRPGMRRGMVWGVHDEVGPPGARPSFKQRFRKYASGQEALCCNVLSDQLLAEYHQRLLRFAPEVLYGYPSALVHLGRFIEDRGLEPIRVNTIITTAEGLRSSTKHLLARAFGGEVFNLYCTREHGCIAFECGQHEGLHIDVGSVFVEIVRDGRPVKPGETGQIVITDLLNFGMPFIRSQIGDVGMLSPDPCKCGSPLPLLKGLDGRASDLIYRPDGAVVPGILLTDLFVDMPAIRYFQFVQDSAYRIEVLLVVTETFSDEDREKVVRQVRELLGDEISVEVRLVDQIQRSPRSGKLQEIISTVKQPHADERVQKWA